jgi:hypothetical protein
MVDLPIPEESIPMDLLLDFQTRWSVMKSCQEFYEYAKEHHVFPEMEKEGTLDQAFYLLGKILGRDAAVSFAAIMNAVSAAYQSERAPAKSELSVEKPTTKSTENKRKIN